ncbi:MAG: PD40 domain-containing protein [Chloroflexi bacterium]|nr:PD40 domain-containing protein [Chloroflexota bacterium]
MAEKGPRSGASIGNPYIIDRPLSDEDLFVGRTRALRWLRDAVSYGERLLAVGGGPGIGTTSFLLHLARMWEGETTALYVDLAPEAKTTPAALLAQLTTAVRDFVCIGSPAEVEEEESLPASLARAAEVAAPKRLLLLVDGIGKKPVEPGEWAQVVAELRAALAGCPSLLVVLGVEEPAGPGAMAIQGVPTYQLDCLSADESEELLRNLGRARIGYEHGAIRAIYNLCGGHPYLVQAFGFVLFERLGGEGRVTYHDVLSVEQEVVEVGNPVFGRTWENSSPAERVVLAALQSLRGRHGVFTRRDVQDGARWQGVELPDQIISDGLRLLVARKVLRPLSQEGYEFAVRLFQNWLAANVTLANVVREVSHSKKAALSVGLRWPRRRVNWGTVLLWVALIAIVVSAFVLWSERGSGQLTTPTPTSRVPVVASPTLSLGLLGTKIAYAQREHADATWDIWVMGYDGTDPVRLTNGPRNNIQPAWSPDVRRIYFVSDRDGNREIYVMNADGTGQTNLTRDGSEDWTPAVSPDGKTVAFASIRDGNWEIYVMNADGSRPTRLTRNTAADYSPVWSPDGSRLAFQSNRDGNWEIYIMNADGSNQQRLTYSDATDSSPAWSPDGSQIAFESYRDGDMEIYVMNADGSNQVNLTNEHTANDHGPTWSPDGTHIAFYSNRAGGWDIYTMKADGTGQTNITFSPVHEQAPAWQPYQRR